MFPRAAILLALVACKDDPDASSPLADPTARMVRASLDLRGVRPSQLELDRLAADPASADALIGEWLEDPRFELRVRDLFARVWRTRVDQFDTSFFSDFSEGDTPLFLASVGDEPLVVISQIAAQDRPHTDIVTSPTTWANGSLAKKFPVDYPEDGSGWQEVTYTDGRPMAGVLSTNGLWWRYLSTPENYNRGRANALSRILLCSDFAARPVEFSRAEVEEGEGVGAGATDRTQTDPSCLSCHAGLDPLGSLLYGFHSVDGYTPSARYSLGHERDWMSATAVEPAYFGQPVSDLRELGVAIAQDPRFLQCAVEQVYTGLHAIQPEQADPETLARHHEAFLQGGARLKALYRSIVTDPEYGSAPRRMLPIESLVAAVEDLTGYVWEYEGVGMLASDEEGLRTLGGGIDSRTVTRPATTPNATTALVTERLAELAAPYAVQHDAERPSEEQLLRDIDFTETLEDDRAELEATVQRLVRRALGRLPTDEETAGLLETWGEAALVATPQEAWAVVLTVLVRDPEFTLY
jgi:hypothetical protein